MPYIGFFTTEYKAAESDIVNRQILPPVAETVFKEEMVWLSPGLIKYLAITKNIDETEAAGGLYSFCTQWKQKIDAGEKLCFETVGCLQKNETGAILFTKENNHAYYKAVPAERVVHKNSGHAVLVDDKQTSSAAMNIYYTKEPVVESSTWRVWAIVFFAIGLILLIYSFYNHKFTTSAVGNRSGLAIPTAGDTHFDLSQ